jgi:hypothetical protein
MTFLVEGRVTSAFFLLNSVGILPTQLASLLPSYIVGTGLAPIGVNLST